jgi:hypothetical protein
VFCIERAQPIGLAAATITPGVEKIRSLTPTFGGEVAEAEHAAVQHEADELAALGIDARALHAVTAVQ